MIPNNPKLSIVIPIYNSELYLNKCVDSILSQKSTDVEIILVDDGSTDKSSLICDAYSKRHRLVKTIHQNNTGVAGARNTGIKESTGDYLFFVDNDDWIDGTKLQNLINILKTKNVDIVINKYIIAGEKSGSIGNGFIDKKYIDNKNQEDVLNYLRRNRVNIMAPWEYVVKKEIIIKNNISFNTDQNGVDDSCFTPILFCNCNSFYLNNNIIYFWRQRHNSQGSTHKKHEYLLKMLSTIKVLETNTNFAEKYKNKYIYFSIYKNIYSLLGQYKHYPKEDRNILDKWCRDNKNLIKNSTKSSGLFHGAINVVFGGFWGTILSYKLAVLKGDAYLLFYKKIKYNLK